MSKTYTIKNMPGLSGLHCVGDVNGDVIEIRELINIGIVIGDRLLRYPIPSNSLFIDKGHVEEVDDITAREFSAENPYGEYKYEGHFEVGDLHIAHAVYENAISVTIYENIKGPGGDTQKTLYTGNFFESREAAAEVIDELLHGQMDADDVIFELKNLEEN